MSESHGSWRPCESRWKTLRHPCRPRPGWWWGPLDVGPWTRTSRRPHGDEKIWGSDDQTDQTKDLRHALSIFVVCRVAMVVAVAVANCALASDSSPNTEHKKSDASSFMRHGNSNLMALPFRATQQSSGIQCRFTCHGMSATSGENWMMSWDDGDYALFIIFLIIHDHLQSFNVKKYVLAASCSCSRGLQSSHNVFLLFVKICRRPQKPQPILALQGPKIPQRLRQGKVLGDRTCSPSAVELLALKATGDPGPGHQKKFKNPSIL